MSYGSKMIEEIQSKNVAGSEKYLELALAKDSIEDLYLLADTLFQMGFLNDARSVLMHLQKADPTDDEIRVNLAEIEIEDGNENEALEWLYAISEDSDAYPQALLVMADLAQSQGLYEVSEQKLVKVKEILGDEPVIQFALAELHFSMGKYAQAIREYEKLLVQGDDTFAGVNLNNRLGSAYSALGDWNQAIDYFEEGLSEEETTDTLFQLAFTYFQKKEYEKSNELLFKVKELDPAYTTAYPYLAKGLKEMNDLEKAAEVIQQGIHEDKTNAGLYITGAEIALKNGEHSKAEGYYEDALRIEPSNEANLLAYVNLLLIQEKFGEVIELIEKNMEGLDGDPQLHWSLALAKTEMEDYASAAENYQKAYPYFRNNAAFLKEYFFFLREEGKQSEMDKIGREYLAIFPNDHEIVDLMDDPTEFN